MGLETYLIESVVALVVVAFAAGNPLSEPIKSPQAVAKQINAAILASDQLLPFDLFAA